ncbi:RDD family protein [Actinoplanes sp. NPDC049668]|uniref:RDD family protein n=1 Tax=unclassified Actinoplanes TaxID=2626549 RepID=UPI0033BDCB82
MTQANDDLVRAAAHPPVGGPVRPPVPPQAGGPPRGGPPPPPQYGYHGPPRQPYRWQPPPLAPDGRPLADFATRLLSYLIDYAIMTGVMMVVLVPAAVVFMFKVMPDFDEALDSPAPLDFGEVVVPFLLLELGLLVLTLVGYYVYNVEMMFRSGQTVGKKLMKIRVVPLTPGAALTRGMAAKRYLIEYICGVFVPFFAYLDGLWQLWDKPFQQTLHDKVAKTVVVKVAP